MFRLYSFIGALLLLSIACSHVEKKLENQNPIVKVYGKVLYHQDLEHILTGNESTEDSALMINAFVERWIRDQVMIYEAEQQVRNQQDIDELVADYRQSLILHDYEQQLLEAFLDTLVGDSLIQEHYEKNEKDYLLNEDVWFIRMCTANNNAFELETFKEFVKSDRYSFNPDSLCTFMDIFLTSDKMKLRYPDVELDMESIYETYMQWRDDLKQFIYVVGYYSSGSLATLPYIRNEIEKLIIHKRKIKLLEKIKEDNYQKALSKKFIKYQN